MKEQLLETFVAAIRENKHLLPLLPKEEWILVIKIGKEQWNISVSKSNIAITAKREHIDSTLHCSLQDWEYIMSGKQKLRQALKMGNIVYEGTFRSLLMLEAIFFLSPAQAPELIQKF